MEKYRCKACGYDGEEFIFEYDVHSYCLATNEIDPEYRGQPPEWVGRMQAEIGNPEGCPKCKAWGLYNFEEIENPD